MQEVEAVAALTTQHQPLVKGAGHVDLVVSGAAIKAGAKKRCGHVDRVVALVASHVVASGSFSQTQAVVAAATPDAGVSGGANNIDRVVVLVASDHHIGELGVAEIKAVGSATSAEGVIDADTKKGVVAGVPS